MAPVSLPATPILAARSSDHYNMSIMKKDMSNESFRAVESAATRILDQRGTQPANAAHYKYQEEDLGFFRHANEVWITHKETKVFHAYPQHSGEEASIFVPGDWMDDVERIAQSLAEKPNDGAQ
jgi:hypothetical protein